MYLASISASCFNIYILIWDSSMEGLNRSSLLRQEVTWFISTIWRHIVNLTFRRLLFETCCMIQRLLGRFVGSKASIKLYVRNRKLFRRREALPDWYHRIDNKALQDKWETRNVWLPDYNKTGWSASEGTKLWDAAYDAPKWSNS
jgi:hypothetical protein